MMGCVMRYWPFRPERNSSSKLLSVLLVLSALAFSGCASLVKSTKSTAVLLKTFDRQPATALIEKVNQLQQVTSLRGPASVRLTDLKLAQQGKIEPYRPADALIVLKRPENIRLLIRVPIVKQNIADMTSDGEHFRIAIFYPDEYRRFLIGTNNRSYEDKIDNMKMISDDNKKEQISSIAKIRPQHITDAVLIKPIATDGSVQYFISEVTREETETRSGQQPRQIIRSFQVLYLLQPSTGGELKLLREFWFDRTQANLPLTRMLIYDSSGLAAEVNYKKYASINGFPRQIEIVRARDNYALELSFNSNLEENSQIEQQVFMLENVDKLPERDLDVPQPPRASPEH